MIDGGMIKKAPIKTVRLPNDWVARPRQRAAWNYLRSGGKRAVLVWHRRYGKDSLAGNFLAVAASLRVGNYWHMFPTAQQGRRALWMAIDRQGRRMIDQMYPQELRAGKPNETEMLVRLRTGSTIQIVGSDHFDGIVGANPVGIVFSEWSLTDPRAWDILSPILRENDGIAIFPYTPRGKNHGWSLFQTAQKQPEHWFCERLTVEDTGYSELAEQAKRDGISEQMIRQEYYCSFDAPLHGAYYAAEMMAAEATGRIGEVPHDPYVLVDTWWDLGVGDATAIWFAQRIGAMVHLIDYREHRGVGLPAYAEALRTLAAERGYRYGIHVLPHDVRARDLSTGETRLSTLEALGVTPIHVVGNKPMSDRGVVAEGIEQVRRMLARCRFDAVRCERGIEALRSYREAYVEDDSRTGEQRYLWKGSPHHDWASHGADAFRMGAMYRPQSADWFQPLSLPKLGIL